MGCHVLWIACRHSGWMGDTASELEPSQLLEIVRACPMLEQLALLGVQRISKKDLTEAITQLPELQVGCTHSSHDMPDDECSVAMLACLIRWLSRVISP
jgi:hypothetical protein